MVIGIDCRELGKPQMGGFRSYLAGLLSGLAEIDDTNDYIIYSERPIADGEIRFPDRSCFRVVSGSRFDLDFRLLPRVIKADKPDLLHFPCNYGLTGLGIPSVITIHDCLFLKRRAKLFSLKGNLLSFYAAHMAMRSAARADVVLTVSDYSRGDINRMLRVSGPIVVTHLAPTPGVARTGDMPGISEGPALEGPYMLLLASVDPRKNSGTVVKAFARSEARRDGCKLVAVCSHPAAAAAFQRDLVSCGISAQGEVRLAVSDSDLGRIYESALGFVFASLEEGFGLPPLEAMTWGCPVLAARSSAMPEVLGDDALFFDPLDVDSLVGRMDLLWRDVDLRMELKDRGLCRSATYTWTKTARATLDAYGQAMDAARQGPNRSS